MTVKAIIKKVLVEFDLSEWGIGEFNKDELGEALFKVERDEYEDGIIFKVGVDGKALSDLIRKEIEERLKEFFNGESCMFAIDKFGIWAVPIGGRYTGFNTKDNESLLLASFTSEDGPTVWVKPDDEAEVIAAFARLAAKEREDQ